MSAIQNVAIVGAGGHIGGAFAKALIQAGNHVVTALSRFDSKSQLPMGANIIKVNYEDVQSIAKALKGQHFLVITLAATAPEETHAKIVKAAAEAGVPYVMPNAFSYPIYQDNLCEQDLYTSVIRGGIANRVSDIQRSGAASVVLCCGFWYEWTLAMGESSFGFSIRDRKITFFDDGKRTITVSTWEQCGLALASLLSLPETITSPSLADYKNRNVLISSFSISQRDILDSLHRVLGTTDDDWDIKYESSAQRVKEGVEEMREGSQRGFIKWLCANTFLPGNIASDFTDKEVANSVLGLPEEDLDDATKRVVTRLENGWSPFEELGKGGS
ncbi:hypothetical protein FOMG_16315 [Fusarium oxysporum f. sp. melonis 26406]|uniref:NAD(P)-binding domain-containing protein n=1 Tax=Fusarium oxysporum f. sp. melonis 26406 TaxID=1089452 RepID=W9ZFA4_FUSOX|nr:hypothetical protein FOMG_16315 [Fusarium oxysporum f. sp. melonis 26406]KAJ9416832.1 hypothetical protein QL093DRAFT_2042710 [Fusarium oxysporum]